MACASERERDDSGEKDACETDNSRESIQAVSITVNLPADQPELRAPLLVALAARSSWRSMTEGDSALGNEHERHPHDARISPAFNYAHLLDAARLRLTGAGIPPRLRRSP
jgi:hypothetical protein